MSLNRQIDTKTSMALNKESSHPKYPIFGIPQLIGEGSIFLL